MRKLEQLVHPSPMSFGRALMRPTHTGSQAGRNQSTGAFLFELVSGELSRKRAQGMGPFQFVHDLSVMPNDLQVGGSQTVGQLFSPVCASAI